MHISLMSLVWRAYFFTHYTERADIYEAAAIADRQLKLLHEISLESKNLLPVYSIYTHTRLDLGMVNWGRGIG